MISRTLPLWIAFDKMKASIVAQMEGGFPEVLTYHNVHHVLDVFSAAEFLAGQENISEKDTFLLLSAVLYHDTGFMIGPKNHEELSCDLAQQQLPEFGYISSDIQIVCSIIKATRIPQKPQNHVEKIICDADLDYLGREDFEQIGEGLFQELMHFGQLKSRREWDERQVHFMEQHQYFTLSAQRIRNEGKKRNLELVKQRLQNLKS